MAKKDREERNIKPLLAVALIFLLLYYLVPRGYTMLKQAQYRGKLTNYMREINAKVTQKVAFYQESFVEMYAYTRNDLGSSPLTPISYLYGKNSCEESIDTIRFKSTMMPSVCVDGSILSTNGICILRAQPGSVINGARYYMVYLDLDCHGGAFNKDKYKNSNFVDIDKYAIDPEYEDIVPLIFNLSEGNFYLSYFPDKTDERYKKVQRLFKCPKGLFYDKKCEI